MFVKLEVTGRACIGLEQNIIDTAVKWIEKALCFPQVVQKQTLGEVENWMVIWWQVVSWTFIPKIIKIW